MTLANYLMIMPQINKKMQRFSVMDEGVRNSQADRDKAIILDGLP